MITPEEAEILKSVMSVNTFNRNNILSARDIIFRETGKYVNPGCTGCFYKPCHEILIKNGFELPKSNPILKIFKKPNQSK